MRKVDVTFIVGHTEQVKIGEITVDDNGAITGQLMDSIDDSGWLNVIPAIIRGPQPMIFAAIFMPSAKDLLESFTNTEESS